MQIYFNTITYGGKPLIWEYDEQSNQVFCLFKCIDTNINYEKRQINQFLKLIPNITITASDDALIENATEFFSEHPKSEFALYRSSRAITHLGVFANGEKVPSLKNNNNEACPEASLTLDYLTSEDLFIETFRKTVHFRRMTERLKQSLNAPPQLIQTHFTVVQRIEKQRNMDLYEQKEKQCEQLAILFDTLLAPLYTPAKESRGKKNPVIHYFQKAVERIMDNAHFNGATVLEQTPYEKDNSSFMSHAHYQAGIRFMRKAQVQIMLWPLLFLCNDEIAIQDLSDNEEVLTTLGQLKDLTADTREQIASILSALQECTVQSGIIATQATQFQNKMEKNNVFPECIEGMWSCHRMLLNVLKARGLKEKIAKDVIKQVIDALKSLNCPEQISRFAGDENDFYLFEPQIKGLVERLNTVSLDNNGKKRTRGRSEKIAERFTEEVRNFLTKAVNDAQSKALFSQKLAAGHTLSDPIITMAEESMPQFN
ncbi:MAG: hypothetical protein WC785_09370 [Tatlockia sp.]|jgi:hypothetical protein